MQQHQDVTIVSLSDLFAEDGHLHGSAAAIQATPLTGVNDFA